MARVDFLISNDGHHQAMTWPVAAALAAGGNDQVRLLSLCELRGLSTPPIDEAPRGVEIRAVLPLQLRSSPSVGPTARPGAPTLARRIARSLIWRLLVAPRLAVLQRRRPDLVVLPNDAAFPFDRIAQRLGRLQIPYLLLQEGIRFPLTEQTGVPVYGAGGAAAVAAWGEASADYFRTAGVTAERIHLTGSPRFDRPADPTEEDQATEPGREQAPARRTLLLASNPIDDQGLCTHQEKLTLIGRFLNELEPLFADPRFRLAIKLHGRESPEEFRRLVGEELGERISIHTSEPLEELFRASSAVVVLASTVGLEALLHGLPLAVLEIPGHGFQYDYAQSGAAAGLSWSTPLAPQVESIFEPSEQRQAHVDAYLQRQFATRDRSTERVVELIRGLQGKSR